jgi:hypothetical protein
MAVDTPARIAVLGAGPIGLEAALYGRYLGYDVDVYDHAGVADNVRRWGHVQMFSPFAMNASPLGLAALAAQHASYRAPRASDLLTGRDYVERYLLPLSQTDLLSDHLQLQTRVLGVARRGLLKDQPIGGEAREDAMFELLVEDHRGQRRTTADIVLDATGTYRTPRWMGAGGLPAIGETECQRSIRYHVPDLLGAERGRFEGRRTLLVGSGHSAATAAVALAELGNVGPATEVIWVTRRLTAGPVAHTANDTLPARARLVDAANRLAMDSQGPVRHLGGGEVRRVTALDPSGFEVEVEVDLEVDDDVEPKREELRTKHGQRRSNEVIRVDQVLALVGYRPDNAMIAELQIQHCHVTEGPMPLAASLLVHAPADCLTQPPPRAQTLTTTEPRYFALGSKSYGRNSHFLIATGLGQIQQVFSLLADRHGLDLYANMHNLLP